MNLYKRHPKNPYLFWAIMSIVLQVSNEIILVYHGLVLLLLLSSLQRLRAYVGAVQ